MWRSPATLLEATWLLAASRRSDAPGEEVQLAAVKLLRDAPPDDAWNRGLLGGLRSASGTVVSAVVKAMVERLETCAAPEAQDQMADAMLDAVFLNLSGRLIWSVAGTAVDSPRETDSARVHERNAAWLVSEVQRWLQQKPLAFEHVRSRLVARARTLSRLHGDGGLSEAVVDFQRALAAGERSDQRVMHELHERRRRDTLRDPAATQPTLLAFLNPDSELTVADVSQERFTDYRLLLTGQSKELAGDAMLKAMDNLIRWLDQVPQTTATRQERMNEVVEQARKGIPWDQLTIPVRRHLEAHYELVPGPDHPEDLLRMLHDNYDTPEGTRVFVRGLQLLARLPLVRTRSEEIERLTMGLGKTVRQFEAWIALIDFIAGLATGLEDLVFTADRLQEKQLLRLQLLRQTLSHDRHLRGLLRELAVGTKQKLSSDAETERRVREHAWRRLLSCLPPDTSELIREGLLDHGGHFFRATLEEAARLHQRQLWDFILPYWPAVVGTGSEPGRHERIRLLLSAFRGTLNAQVVRSEPDGTGLLIKLALDDADSDVRREVETTLVECGYQAELQRERQRRELLRSVTLLRAAQERWTMLDHEFTAGFIAANQARTVAARPILQLQEGIQAREFVVTQGWLDTARIQVDLEEIRLAITQRLAEADRESELLAALSGQFEAALRQAEEYRSGVDRIVREQANLERRLSELRRQLSGDQQQLASESAQLSSFQRQRTVEGNREPASPGYYDDPDAAREAQNRYRHDMNEYRRRLNELNRAISAHSLEVERLQHEISSLERQIGDTETQLGQLRSQLAVLRRQQDQINRTIANLHRQVAACRLRRDQIQSEIDRLQARQTELRDTAARQREQLLRELAQNDERIRAGERELSDRQQQAQARAESCAEVQRARNQQETECQRLAQVIQSGRQDYRNVGERADRESGTVEARGYSLSANYAAELYLAQEAMVHYVEGMHRALRRQGRLPTRAELQRRREPREEISHEGG
jgi:predicted  nucleic acid-binding Zn-ribbon protein